MRLPQRTFQTICPVEHSCDFKSQYLLLLDVTELELHPNSQTVGLVTWMK